MHRTHPSAVLKCQQKLRSGTEGRGALWPRWKVPFLSQQWLFSIAHVTPAPTQPSPQAARQDKHWILHSQAGAPQPREHKRITPMLPGNLSAGGASAKAAGVPGSASARLSGTSSTPGPLSAIYQRCRARLHPPLLPEILHFPFEKAFLDIFFSCSRKKKTSFRCFPLTLQCFISCFL